MYHLRYVCRMHTKLDNLVRTLNGLDLLLGVGLYYILFITHVQPTTFSLGNFLIAF